jgi:hypothetical protein
MLGAPGSCAIRPDPPRRIAVIGSNHLSLAIREALGGALMLRRVRPALVAALSASVIVAGATVAASGGQKLIDSPMAGIPSGAPTIDGVLGGGIAWVIDEGHAQLRADGRLHIDVQGLVLASGGAAGTNPIPTGVGIVTCGNGATTITTDPVPFSTTGDAEVNTRVSLPATCLAPNVFYAGGTAGGPRWFAVNGG